MDYYVKATDLSVLKAFCDSVPAVIGPLPAPLAEGEEAPALWYACVRAAQLGLQDGVVLCDEAEGRTVCGVWL